MLQKIIYEEVKKFPIKTLSIVGEFNDWDKDTNYFKKNADGKWEIEIDFPPGKNLYKLVFNGEMTMNDPTANLYIPNNSNELMSAIVISEENDKRLYNNEQCTINLSQYSLNNYISKDLTSVKRSYILENDRKIVLGIAFKEVKGLHSVTVAWYCPDGALHHFTENILYQPEEMDEVKLWFWLDLKPDLPLGQWHIKLFIDGLFIHKDIIGISDKEPDKSNDLLPIGTVVLLKDKTKRLMIYGRYQKSADNDKVWDYIGCLYPEGNIINNKAILFDHEQIERIDHMGLKDYEEESFLERLKEALKNK
ncbi:UNVERIFIED_CONTAM: hypothetical protein Cloal_2787 [Acetivibrio alkalicellulosi]